MCVSVGACAVNPECEKCAFCLWGLPRSVCMCESVVRSRSFICSKIGETVFVFESRLLYAQHDHRSGSNYGSSIYGACEMMFGKQIISPHLLSTSGEKGKTCLSNFKFVNVPSKCRRCEKCNSSFVWAHYLTAQLSHLGRTSQTTDVFTLHVNDLTFMSGGGGNSGGCHSSLRLPSAIFYLKVCETGRCFVKKHTFAT